MPPTLDRSTIISSYRSQLSLLTFNSKPIINSLTLKEDEYKIYSNDICDLISEIIISINKGESRLPYIYLMDSILKNVKLNYIDSFVPYVSHIIVTTYTLLDSKLKEKLIHLVRSWIDIKLFNNNILQKIQDGIGKRIEPTSELPKSVIPPSNLKPIKPANVLPVKRVAEQNELPNKSISSSRPHPVQPPRSARNELDIVWRELESRVLSTREDLIPLLKIARDKLVLNQDISMDLRELARLLSMPPPPPLQPQVIMPMQPMNIIPADPYMPMNTSPQPLNNESISAALASLSAFFKPAVNPPPNSAQLRGLAVPNQDQFMANDFQRFPAYTASDLLSNLKIRNDRAIAKLYTFLKLQCKTCAFRCPDEKAMGLHMDYHFVVNRREQFRKGNKLNQQWFETEDDWVSLTSLKIHSKMEDEEDKLLEDKEETKYFPEDTTRTKCDFCFDEFTKIWNEEDEVWVYQGVVEVDNKLVHVDCLKSNKENSQALAYEDQLPPLEVV